MEAANPPKGKATLQCPNCGLHLYEDHFSFPRCHRCDTLVQACRHCMSHDHASGQCIEPTSPVEDVVDPDALTTCPFFKQGEVVIEKEPPLFQSRFWLYAGIGAAAVVLLVFLVQHFIVAPLRAPAEGLTARVGLPDVLTASTPWDIEITVSNEDTERALGFRVEFPSDTVQRFEILDPSPAATSKEEHRGGQRLTFEPIPPSGRVRITMPVQAKRAGYRDFEMLVTNERGRLVTRCSRTKLEVQP